MRSIITSSQWLKPWPRWGGGASSSQWLKPWPRWGASSHHPNDYHHGQDEEEEHHHPNDDHNGQDGEEEHHHPNNNIIWFKVFININIIIIMRPPLPYQTNQVTIRQLDFLSIFLRENCKALSLTPSYISIYKLSEEWLHTASQVQPGRGVQSNV